ncbi:putative TrmH family tRNA/rRNA methyltransferase YacO [Geobacter sp. OR-1]|uniref:23S rRNA (guanosine(2251)-2'-O)-methyltransferase RlmB n=1 Tax=Geobacter sp. OR-1 TaxID=1266765 RepID=UPI000542296C|nr:23S rRNA (guanosine(2251)-2'-O)-methyltransferase RlmB [Geobacter sp. OR-1]GAM10836.1 putative TrmH family tRNA/rRNA methyltransferase YacO [Geobacter sp. OR-1]
MAEEIVYGINAVTEALRGKRKAFELFISGPMDERRMERIIKLARERGVSVRQRQKQDLTRLAGSDHHQGVALKVEPFPYSELEDIIAATAGDADSLLLLLDSVQDPANLGSLARSAACAGASGIVITKDRSVGVTPSVERVSAGAVETLPVARVTNLVQALEQLKEAGFWIYGLADDASATIYSQKFCGKVALLVGSEGEGIRPLVRKACDVVLSIPIHGGVSSLNAAVAGSIALFEVVRQRSAGSAG